MKTKLIGYWAVGTSPRNGVTHEPGSIFVGVDVYQAGAAEMYAQRGYKLIPSYIEDTA